MNILEEIKKVLLSKENIVFAYVFGSYARNTMTENSDIDIAIYQKDKEISTDDYLSLKVELEDKTKKEVDLVILNEADPLVKHEVFIDGIRLFSRDETLESNFKVHTVFEYEDTKRFREKFYNNMIEKLRKEVENDSKDK
ncbi:type VII toxin-antitoxin system MntA family adenylyltransferase antitoxin [Thermohalobacter berrensis]|uniref:DNA polymerase beta n=1 Tax=Thermohalobacter berrensis TaxID=99594 RepID=A0A419T3Y3_9FIRM|nr:nucleotidyltransferase domain-containing protein [Thermohalobacter berrensis]RKD32260.1 DNA polymerase beta [Thermohalobacter berrensis]